MKTDRKLIDPGVQENVVPALLAAITATAVLFLFSDPVCGQLSNSTVHTGAPPAWVEMIEPDSTASYQSNSAAGGQVFDLIDTQVNVASEESYSHVVKEITTEAGVKAEPTWNSVGIHRFRSYSYTKSSSSVARSA